MVENQCREVKGGGDYQSRCHHPGMVQRAGVWWCGHHDPERVAAKARARGNHVRAEIKAHTAIEEVLREIDKQVEKHPDFKEVNGRLKEARTEYHRLLKGRTKVGLHSYGGRS